LPLKLANFVMQENQPILFCAALNKMKQFWAAWDMLLFIWAAHKQFLKKIAALGMYELAQLSEGCKKRYRKVFEEFPISILISRII
jgi:hypothetical protein